MGDRPSVEYQLFNLRLPVDTLSRRHRYRDYLNQTQPGIDANVSMAARMLLFRALDQVEEEMGVRKKAKAGIHDLVRGKKRRTSPTKGVPAERVSWSAPGPLDR